MSTRHQRTTDGGVAAKTDATGGTRRGRTTAAAGGDLPFVSERLAEPSPIVETMSGEPAAPPAGTEEVIALTAWRPGFGIRAALRRDLATVNVPIVGPVTLPGFAHVAWYAGVAALVTLEIVEPPVAALMVVAKALSDSRHHEALRSFGEAVESGV